MAPFKPYKTAEIEATFVPSYGCAVLGARRAVERSPFRKIPLSQFQFRPYVSASKSHVQGTQCGLRVSRPAGVTWEMAGPGRLHKRASPVELFSVVVPPLPGTPLRADLYHCYRRGMMNQKRTNVVASNDAGKAVKEAWTVPSAPWPELPRAELPSSELTAADVPSAGPHRTLTGTDLTGTDLTGTDLTGADLAGADLAGADLAGAGPTGAGPTGTTLPRRDPLGSHVPELQLPGPQVPDLQLAGPQLAWPQLAGPQLAGPKVSEPQPPEPDVPEPELSEPGFAEVAFPEPEPSTADDGRAASRATRAGRAPAILPEEDDTESVVEAAGHFRIYLGAVAGVGKTYDMLNEGKRRLERGTDVVVCFVEAHKRPLTEALLEGFEVVPRQKVQYRGAWFEEMDLDAVLARHPKVALVDELAHTNVPGSGRHAKRWEDALELLDAGIDVITTLNIQHVESLADAVEQMTGAHVRERVPDWVVRKADQIELVDSSPEQLRRRMLHGNIYPAEKVPYALTHFFQTDNLIALRELALRYLADETEEELLEHLRRHSQKRLWETRERILVAVTGAPGTDTLLRRAARMASRAKGELNVVHIISSDAKPDKDKAVFESLRKLVSDLGAHWYDVTHSDPAQAITDFAQEHQITQIVLGSSQRSRWQELTGGGPIVRKVIRKAGDLGIDVHVIARRQLPPGFDHASQLPEES